MPKTKSANQNPKPMSDVGKMIWDMLLDMNRIQAEMYAPKKPQVSNAQK